MYRLKELNKWDNYCNLADECRITIMNCFICGSIKLEEHSECIGEFNISCQPKNGKLYINEYGQWKYMPNEDYTGLDFFEIVYIKEKEKKKEYRVIVSVAPRKQIFKQISVEGNLIIPEVKPDIEEVINVFVDAEILYKNIIRTSKGESFEGKTLTGYKLFIMGFLNQQVEYIGHNRNQSVHVAHFRVPFSTYVILPSNYCELFPVSIEIIIEDIFHFMINKREIFENITFMLYARSC
jgi:hypothetical protein